MPFGFSPSDDPEELDASSETGARREFRANGVME